MSHCKHLLSLVYLLILKTNIQIINSHTMFIKIYNTCFKLTFSCFCFGFLFQEQLQAQTIKPGINFQAIAKDDAGNPANNRKVYVEASIIKGTANGAVVFGEYHTTNSNENGIFNIVIGKGERFIGVNDIYAIDWPSAKYFFHLKIAITPITPSINWEKNNEWIDLGSVEFGVVPYAIQSLTSNVINIDTSIFNTKLNVSDTSVILSPYATKAFLDIKLYKKLNISDTASMLLPYHNKLGIGDSVYYITPYQFSLNHFDTSYLSNRINTKFNIKDTATILLPYIKRVQMEELLNSKLNIADTNAMLSPYAKQLSMNSNLNTKLNITDTASMLNARISRDTISLSNRINFKEDLVNKSVDISLLSDYNNLKYPSVKAIKDYVDASLIAGAPDASTNNKGIIQLAGDLEGTATNPLVTNNAITTNKLQDAAVTDAKLASGLNPTKFGLGNVTNNAQLYNFNGLTSQQQSLSVPGIAGLAPNWVSVGSNHLLNIPMAAASSVSAGLISKLDYDHFNTSYDNRIISITNIGNNGVASISNHVLNIPSYTLTGLVGNENANTVFAGPAAGAAGTVGFRSLVSADIPNNAANTLGNASTASKLAVPIYINNVLFDGSTDIINVTAQTPNVLTFSNNGLGDLAGSTFNGSTAKYISYNTVGAAPAIGSNSITTLGNIITGAWLANIIGSNYGGAGNNNGILKANGLGVVSAAIAGTDFQRPLNFDNPLINTSNTISIPQASNVNSGYLSNIDWAIFNNKIDLNQKAVNNGVASLDANGKIPTSQIPSISFSSGYVVTSENGMLALSNAVVGSIAIRTDNSKNYVLSGLPASTLANWLELLMPVSVSSVNGHTESNITLTTSDISEGTNLFYTNTRARNSISASSPIVYNTGTGVFSIPNASSTVAGYLTAADWTSFNNKMGVFTAQTANSFYAGPATGVNALPTFRGIVAGDIPTLNQNTTGNAATATKLAATKNINGVAFDGSANIIITAAISNAITFNNSGTGVSSPVSFDGSATKTISYNTIGAAPAIGSSTITTLGSITAGTWLGNTIDASHGGAGANAGILKANGSGLVSAAIGGTDFENPLTFSLPLLRTTNTISISAATAASNGYLTSTDWNLFNNKQTTLAASTGVILSNGNTISIGQSVANTDAPTFSGATLTGLNIAGIVTNTAGGILGTAATTGSGNIVRSTSPNLVTPVLGAATATSVVVSGDVTAKRFKLTMPNAITAAATTTIDLSAGNVFTVNMGLNISTLTLTNPGVGTYLIKFVQDATGTRDIIFPSTWKWAGGVIPSLTNTANKLDIVTLIYDGVTYYTTIVQNF
jgi:hypothetical protein